MHINNRYLELAFVLLISISLSLGLELSVSTGGQQGMSSATSEYGAKIGDHAKQCIVLNPSIGTISNAFSGTGSLPSSSLGICDSKGNYAYVSRSVNGETGVTKWSYEWDTYRPYSSSFGSGVGAILRLTATNAYSIYGSGYSSNKIGNVATASVSVGPSSPYPDSSIVDYYVNPTSFVGEARVDQSACYAKTTGIMEISDYSRNAEGDEASSSIYLIDGSISKPATTTYSRKTSACSNSLASAIAATDKIKVNVYASNNEGDSGRYELSVNNGKITNLNQYGLSTKSCTQIKGSVYSAYGTLADVSSQGLNNALGYQEHWSWNAEKNAWERTKVKVERGEGVFAASKRDNIDLGRVTVNTVSTRNDITISTSGFGVKTALVLDPEHWEFVHDIGANDIRDAMMAYLKGKGYAVTYYSDSAVSKDIVKKMDEYQISIINSYTTPTSMRLSRSSDGANWDTITASELKSAYTYKNKMALIVGPNSFSNTGSGTWEDAVKKASVRGGTTSSWDIPYSRDFINKYLYALSYFYSASGANSYASDSDSNKLLVLGDTDFII
jgi:hypothetical protein